MGMSTISAQSQQLPGRDSHLPNPHIGTLTKESLNNAIDRKFIRSDSMKDARHAGTSKVNKPSSL